MPLYVYTYVPCAAYRMHACFTIPWLRTHAGGETGIADELDAEGLVEGIVVEPKRGRLLLFSGGGENYHAPMDVRRGRRAAWHAWFTCADS